MQVTLCKNPFEYIIIDDTYTQEELKLIFLELDFLTLSNNLMDPEYTGAAEWEDGSSKKNNLGIFLNNVYKNNKCSNILKFNRKIYNIKINEPSVINNYLKESNYDSTLISYYENKMYYKSHVDISVITAITYLYKKPKTFEGGDLVFTEYGYAFEPWFNRTYIIPGVVEHEVTEVLMKQEDCGKGLGRYCISNFIYNNFREQISN